MAAPIPQGFSCLSRFLGWWSRQPVLVTQSAAIVPVRTKKRFTPPIYQPKFKTEKEFMQHARKAGLVIPPEKSDRSIHLACTAGIFDAYVPPEGDARISSLSKEGLIERTERMKKTMASQVSIRRIKDYDANFKIKDFPEKAKDIFIEAHLCLNNSDHDRLHTLVTEHCFPTLAIYDRFGRLMYGQEDVPKDVLEYVVFEKQLTNPYGSWRMHTKIVPPWAPPKQPILKTVMIPGPQLKPEEEYEEAQGEAQKPQLA
ncbi:mitochondrial ribosomal protein L45 [Homo sapiens]|uniref:Large ribosomal subunit protein mL45 n=1 Tax=Homo sapiens TaxID=9606 RepID=A0A087WU62_HUMAN|nr:large ribosomal subunit protein mL45 isoform 2 [Homo sapiens]KAI4049080.1 mitochondrial ribosomal protein L45 [Homo sapiens]|eukprot:NP_001265208.2 39S ribosomal protein L45, mitochondrial isoform 2 [Homo sapiens]